MNTGCRRLFALTALALATGIALEARADLPDATGSVASERYPLWIYFSEEGAESYARIALAAAEEAWAAQVEGMGFPTPLTVDDDGNVIEGLRIYLEETQQYYGHAMAVADVPETPHSDCAVAMMLNDDIPQSMLPWIVAHELNHCLQEAVDCVESPFAYEQVTVATTMLSVPDDPSFEGFLPEFQAQPHRSLHHVSWGSMYHYGAALFSFFLEHTYGRADGALLSRIWDATAQEGSVIFSMGSYYLSVPNEPNLIDAMRLVLDEDGVDFADAFTAFAVARYFTGANDDAAHLPGAGKWIGSEPRLEASHTLDALPEGLVSAATSPEELGMSYIAFDLAAAPPRSELVVRLAGGPGAAWRAVLFGLGPDGAPEVPLELDELQRGEARLPDLEGLERAVLVVVNLGDGEYDSDQMQGLPSSFSYGAELVVCPEVEVREASPRQLLPGETVQVTLHGAGFAEEQPIEVAVSGDGVEATEVVRLSSTELHVTLSVAADAAPGARAVRVALACGAQDEGEGVLEVATQGCGCSGSTPPAPLLALVLPFALLRRRR